MLRVIQVMFDCIGLFFAGLLLAMGKLIMAAGTFLTLVSSYIASEDKAIARPVLTNMWKDFVRHMF